MSHQEINKAIGLHKSWRIHLLHAVESGTIDIPPSLIRKRDFCTFGKWLHGPLISSQDKAHREYDATVILHTQFHETASKIAELALAGRKSEAMAMLSPGGEFTAVSNQLIHTMTMWKEALTPELI